MNEHTFFYYPYASFTNAQLLLLRVATLLFSRLVLFEPVGASLDTVGADHIARDAVCGSSGIIGVDVSNTGPTTDTCNVKQHGATRERYGSR